MHSVAKDPSYLHLDSKSDWADAQADLSLCWAHWSFVGFVMRWLILLADDQICFLQLFRISTINGKENAVDSSSLQRQNISICELGSANTDG